MGRAGGPQVAHCLTDGRRAADGVLLERAASGGEWLVELLTKATEVEAHLLIAGCAPLLARLPGCDLSQAGHVSTVDAGVSQ
jgi:hypothetical protein